MPKIEPWHYRVSGENFTLILTLIVLLILGYLFSTLNVYLVLILVFLGLIYVHLQQAQYMGNAIRIQSNQFPEIYECFHDAAIKLRIGHAALFVKQDPYLNAFTIGFSKCTVVLTSALIEQLNMKELEFVIGHELAHYQASHTKVSTLVSPLGNGNIFTNLVFGFWERKTELSADRCGLILTKNIDPAITCMIKLAMGSKLLKDFNMEAYLEQIKGTESTSIKFSNVLNSHPLLTDRVKNLYKFWRTSFREMPKLQS